MTNFNIGQNQTCWVFISDSDEIRHLSDVVNAIHVLQRRGVSRTSILFFSDHIIANTYVNNYVQNISVLRISSLAATLATISGFDSVVVSVTGHGRPDGIGAVSTAIPPASLIDAIRAIQGLQVGIVILCQCFAGAFNFIDATIRPPVVLAGATNLNMSLSTVIQIGAPIVGVTGAPLAAWSANAFMFYFFEWVSTPVDIDGDGVISLLDGYKYAGAYSALEVSKIKSECFIEAQIAAARLIDASLGDDDLLKDALRTELGELLLASNVSQEPWLLHANLARQIIL